MVTISRENHQQVSQRLESVIRQARLKVYGEPHRFAEFARADFPIRADSNALALIRDDDVWSQLLPTDVVDGDTFAVWRFHFPVNVDNSGFVGWLASLLKERFGTGVFVTCGQNSGAGGIFDYWGCPWTLREEVIQFVVELCKPEQFP